MTLVCALHNLSRSLGVALLAASLHKTATVAILAGELVIFLIYKIARGNLHYWPRFDGLLGFGASVVARFIVKVMTDFTGCIHMRHPYELGGDGFLTTVVLSQALPFVALQFFVGDEIDPHGLRDVVTIYLVASFLTWMLLNFIFFSTIDLQVSDRSCGS